MIGQCYDCNFLLLVFSYYETWKGDCGNEVGSME